MKKRILIGTIAAAVLTASMSLTAFASAENAAKETKTSAVSSVDENENAACIYEAFFLDNEAVNGIFDGIREVPPFEKVTKDFHITTKFMPSEQCIKFYGEKVKIHITAYKIGDVTDDNGSITTNEGLKANIITDNEELREYLDSLNKNFHITGAYKDAAKYTEYVDFSDGIPLDLYVEGTFGCYYSDGTFGFEA